jgi:hypothetical protein
MPPPSGQGDKPSLMWRLDQNSMNNDVYSHLMKISANYEVDGTCSTRRAPRDTFSRTKWMPSSMCLVWRCCTRLADMQMAKILSQHIIEALSSGQRSSTKRWRRQHVSRLWQLHDALPLHCCEKLSADDKMTRKSNCHPKTHKTRTSSDEYPCIQSGRHSNRQQDNVKKNSKVWGHDQVFLWDNEV